MKKPRGTEKEFGFELLTPCLLILTSSMKFRFPSLRTCIHCNQPSKYLMCGQVKEGPGVDLNMVISADLRDFLAEIRADCNSTVEFPVCDTHAWGPVV